jgi:RNA polymerase sigma factor (sigma-70 family)
VGSALRGRSDPTGTLGLVHAPEPPGALGAKDLGELYRSFSGRLLRIVRHGVRAPEPVIEDACQFAWSRLVHRPDRVEPHAAPGWLIATALHEALKSVRRAGQEASLEMMLEAGFDVPSPRGDRSPESLAERHDRLRALASLSERQQRLLWLYGLGLTYDEIARRQGCTSRTVERQIQRARTMLRERESGSRNRPRGNYSARLAGAPARTAPSGTAPSGTAPARGGALGAAPGR